MMRSSSRRHARLPLRNRAPAFRTFSSDLDDPTIRKNSMPLSIPELEIGLRILGGAETKQKSFWDENIVRFRQTVLIAIRDTSDALLEQAISPPWRIELESQLDELVQYLELANRYVDERSRAVSRPTIS
jgi:hypothetical protein